MKRRASAAVLALLLPLACQQPQESGPSAEAGEGQEVVAARVEGVAISVAQLDDFIKEQLFVEHTHNRNAAALFEARKDALDDMIRQHVLDAAAAKRGVSVEDLVEQQAQSLGPVTDEEVAKFYEENKSRVGDRSLEEVSTVIRNYLESRRKEQGIQQLIASAQVEKLLEPPRFEVAADGPSEGPADAPVTIVEFSDFQCPYCQRASSVVKEVRKRYPDSVRVVYMQFPLESIHAKARGAAEASLCAADQDRFWDYHDKLFANRTKLEKEDLLRYAKDLNLDSQRFEQCVADRTHRKRVDEDLAEGAHLGVTGTPAFFVNGIMLSGAKPVQEFTEVIDAELARLGTPGKSAPAAPEAG